MCYFFLLLLSHAYQYLVQWLTHRRHPVSWGASLVVQWLRLSLLMQGLWVWSLVRELRSQCCTVWPKIKNKQIFKKKSFLNKFFNLFSLKYSWITTCVHYCCTAKWLTHICYTYTCILFHILFIMVCHRILNIVPCSKQ